MARDQLMLFVQIVPSDAVLCKKILDLEMFSEFGHETLYIFVVSASELQYS